MGGSVDSKPMVDENDNNGVDSNSNSDPPIDTTANASIANTNATDTDNATTEAEALGRLPQDSSAAAAIREQVSSTSATSMPLRSSALMSAPVSVDATTGMTSTGNTLPQPSQHSQQQQQQQEHQQEGLQLLPPRPLTLMEGFLQEPPPLPSAAKVGISSLVGSVTTPAVATAAVPSVAAATVAPTTTAPADAAATDPWIDKFGGWSNSQAPQAKATPNHLLEAAQQQLSSLSLSQMPTSTSTTESPLVEATQPQLASPPAVTATENPLLEAALPQLASLPGVTATANPLVEAAAQPQLVSLPAVTATTNPLLEAAAPLVEAVAQPQLSSLPTVTATTNPLVEASAVEPQLASSPLSQLAAAMAAETPLVEAVQPQSSSLTIKMTPQLSSLLAMTATENPLVEAAAAPPQLLSSHAVTATANFLEEANTQPQLSSLPAVTATMNHLEEATQPQLSSLPAVTATMATENPLVEAAAAPTMATNPLVEGGPPQVLSLPAVTATMNHLEEATQPQLSSLPAVTATMATENPLVEAAAAPTMATNPLVEGAPPQVSSLPAVTATTATENPLVEAAAPQLSSLPMSLLSAAAAATVNPLVEVATPLQLSSLPMSLLPAATASPAVKKKVGRPRKSMPSGGIAGADTGDAAVAPKKPASTGKKFKAGVEGGEGTAASKFKKTSSATTNATAVTAKDSKGAANKRRTKRRASDSNNVSTLSQKRQRFSERGVIRRRTLAVIDEAPDRLVNPLMEIPGQTVIHRVPGGGPSGGATSSTMAAANAAAATAGMTPVYYSSQAHPQRAADSLALLDLTYPVHVDTFSLAYTARCLGFDVPHITLPENDDVGADLPTTDGATETQQSQQRQPPQPQQQFDKVTLNPADHPVLQDDSYRQIPRLGTFCQTVWLREHENNNTMSYTGGGSASATTNDDDGNTTATTGTSSEPVGLMDSGGAKAGITDTAATTAAVIMDPLYASLLQQPPVDAIPVTAAQQARLLLRAGSSAAAKALQPVLDAARQYLTPLLLPVLPNDNNMKANADSNSWSWISIQEFAHKHPETSRLWSPKSQAATGLFLLQGGLPVGLVAYQFQWVPVGVQKEQHQHQSSATPQQSQQQSQTEQLPLESTAFEPTTTALEATSSELILCLKDLRNTSHSFLHKDHHHHNEQHQHSKTSPALTEREECILMLLMALCLEHARVCHVWYAVLQVTPQLVPFLERYFCMTVVPSLAEASPAAPYDGLSSSNSSQKASSSDIHMVCDMRKCSYRYAFLLYRQDKNNTGPADSPVRNEAAAALSRPQRWLVRLPNMEDTVAALQAPDAATRPKRVVARKTSPYFCGATGQQQQAVVSLRAKLSSTNEPMQIVRLDPQGVEGAPLEIPTFYAEPSLDILRNFALPPKATRASSLVEKKGGEEDELVRELIAKQQELETLEKGIEPTLRVLLGKAVDERMEYESTEGARKREEEKRVQLANKKFLERRKEMDMVWQKQLEQDMDAVCDICKDGEVAPDNQILFCESCNVAVHQMCYGIEHVPEGDYYCLACRHLGRNRGAVSRDPDAPKVAAAPLPICCELCPLKQGAFIRTNMQPKNGGEAAFGKWVHVICAKWQGLNFVDSSKPDLIEDVAEMKMNFRRYDVKCQLCMGDRGAMNQCRFDGCTAWIHVTCARASGTCDVVHGENSGGPVETDPWSLMCPEHSNILPADVPKDAVKIERLIAAAKEFPPEPMPPPPPLVRKPFNAATGKEREALLADNDYEQELLEELLVKKLQGVRCEVCDQVEENGKFLNRCVMCYIVVCDACTLDADKAGGNFKCSSCSHMDAKRKEGEEVDPPNCAACYQKGGLLRRSTATPFKKSHWSQNPREYKKSFFGRELWTHSICAFWNAGANVSMETGEVDLSNIVMSHGRGFVQPNIKCFLCGNSGGSKIKCDHEGCRVTDGDKQLPTSFHATCARQAGLEVNSKEIGRKTHFYVKCYRHGGNEFNLRARLEDLLEIEKKRSGKRFARSDLPMKFSEASRLLNASILVMRILGWAWRWSEWWVDYNSTWEPLLEPGQREEVMTSEQLRIVESTRESRCDDARKCRLAAFGAALRNRKYDTEDGFDRNGLGHALRTVLRTKSLVGPLDDLEIEFFVDWLGRAYRSNSRLLGFDEDSILVGRKGCCLHIQDQSPKFELSLRSVPGTQEPNADQAFEIDTNDIDDFLQTEVFTDELPVVPRRQRDEPARKRKRASADRQRDEPARKRKRDLAEKKRQRASADSKSTMSADVAAVVPSAVKKRLGRPPKERDAIVPPESPSVATSGRKRAGRPPKIRSDAGTSVQESSEQGVNEANAEVKPRKRRAGRPPKIRRPALESESVTEASVEQDHVESDAEPQHPGTRRARRPITERVTEIALPATTAPTTEAPRKRRGRPPTQHHDALDPLPSAASSMAEGVAEFVQEGSRFDTRSESGRFERKRDRSKRSRRPVESVDPASSPAKQVPSGESDPPKKRRGRPPKVRHALGSTLPAASTAESDAAPIKQEEPSADHSAETTLPERDIEAVVKESQPEVSDVTETATVPAIAASPRIRKRKRGRPKRRREEAPYIDRAIAESVADPAIESTIAETADISGIVASYKIPKRKRGRPKRHREEEETSRAVNPEVSKSDVIKRRRHSTTPHQELSMDKEVKSKSYDNNDAADDDDDDTIPESPKRRKRAMSEDDLTIADFVARKGGSSRGSTRVRGRTPDATTAAAIAASTEEQEQKPAARKRGLSRDSTREQDGTPDATTAATSAASTEEQDRTPDATTAAAIAAASMEEQAEKPAASATLLADTSTSRLEQHDPMSLERNDEVPPPPLEEGPAETDIPSVSLSEQHESPAKDSTALPDGGGEAEDTPSKRGRRRGKKEAARTILDQFGDAT